MDTLCTFTMTFHQQLYGEANELHLRTDVNKELKTFTLSIR